MPASWAYASDCGMSTRATLAPARRSPGAGRGRLSRRGPAPATPCCDASIRVATRSCRGNRRPFGRIAALEPVHHSSHHEHGLAPAAAQNRRHVGAPRLVAAHDGERRPGRELVRALPRVSGREEESGCDVPVSVLEALARVYDRVPRGGPVQLVDELHGSPARYTVVDAREGFEYRHGHIAAALLFPPGDAWERADELPTGTPLAVVCGDQTRSAYVASILRRRGCEAVLVMGGMVDWLERGYPTERTPVPAA